MTVLFAGGEQEGFVSIGNVGFATDTSRFDSTFSNGSLGADNVSSITASFESTSDLWFHWLSNYRWDLGTFNDGSPITIFDGATPVVRIRVDASNSFVSVFFQYWNGSSWVNIGATNPVLVQGVKQDIDIHCNFAASGGEFTLYQNGSAVASFTGDTTVGGTAASSMSFQGSTSQNTGSMVSQVVVADESTLSWRVETILATADGAATDWTGTFADIDEVGLANDTSQVNSSTNGQEELFVLEDPTTPTNYKVAALVLASRSKIGSSGPQNMQFLTRSGSTIFPSSNVSGIDLSLRPFQLVQATDPDTSAEWDDTSLAAVQGGVKAIT